MKEEQSFPPGSMETGYPDVVRSLNPGDDREENREQRPGNVRFWVYVVLGLDVPRKC